MKPAKVVINICIIFFIGLAIYFKIEDIRTEGMIYGKKGWTKSVVTWWSMLFYAMIMIFIRILLNKEERRKNNSKLNS